jgi:Domain of unknown function (DUF1707)
MTNPDRESMRASDQDRERAAEVLRQAAGDGRIGMDELDERLGAVYSAKTYAELEPITKDLPSHGTVTAAEPADPARFGGVATSHRVFAFWSGFSRKGAWIVPPKFTARAIMGGGELDLRDARFSERVTVIRAVAVVGGIVITVPDDAEVQVSGVGLMGGFMHPAYEGSPGAPVIIIKGLAFWGGVDVRRRPRKGQRNQPRDLRERLGDGRDQLRDQRHELRDQLRDQRRELHQQLREQRDQIRDHLRDHLPDDD